MQTRKDLSRFIYLRGHRTVEGSKHREGGLVQCAGRVRPETANAGDLDTIRRLGEGRKMCPELQKTFVPMRRRVTLQYGRGRDVGRWAQTKASAPPTKQVHQGAQAT